ncbi:MAG TPA: class I SAM-dependent methyltransferase [Planctomycetota bacterium]|nr:class I SAM-dependent methyltransferase [Planctomycetota bacterium]
MSESIACPICAAETVFFGAKQGTYFNKEFKFRHCPQCRYSFVENYSTEYARIYDENYYRGRGADKTFNYVYEFENPLQTVRQYDWRGILKVVNALKPLSTETRWLDFGCGSGGLVRHVREHSPCRASGFEEGWITDYARTQGVPILARADLPALHGTFDAITAIEVIEHVPNPLPCLKEMRALLKPGGLLFLTTGNARPFRTKFFKWAYVVPEIHASYFEPETLAKALTLAGFKPEFRGAVSGFEDILRFKILKNLGIRKTSLAEKLLPWPLLRYAADKRYKVTAHPIGWAV